MSSHDRNLLLIISFCASYIKTTPLAPRALLYHLRFNSLARPRRTIRRCAAKLDRIIRGHFWKSHRAHMYISQDLISRRARISRCARKSSRVHKNSTKNALCTSQPTSIRVHHLRRIRRRRRQRG